MLSKGLGLALVRALCMIGAQLGFSGGIAFGIVFILKYLLTSEASPYLGHMVLPDGADSGASTSLPAPSPFSKEGMPSEIGSELEGRDQIHSKDQKEIQPPCAPPTIKKIEGEEAPNNKPQRATPEKCICNFDCNCSVEMVQAVVDKVKECFPNE